MKRVLFVLANEPTGGVGVFVRDFCTHFSDDVHVDFLMYTEQRNTMFQNTVRKADTEFYYLPEFTVRNYARLMRLTDEFFRVHHSDYDAVHLTYPGQMHMVLSPARKYGVPQRILHSFNTKLSDNVLKSELNRLLMKNYKKYANTFLACSENAGQYLFGKQMMQSGDVVLIRNAISCGEYRFDQERRLEVRRKLGIGDETEMVLAAGRFEEQKNIGYAVEVFSAMAAGDDRNVLYLIGDGPLKRQIEEKVHSFGMDSKVVFTGFTDRLNDYILAADLLLFPSLYEGLPITLIDAQCCGLPCLMSDSITSEVVLTDLIKSLSLKDSPEIWAENGKQMTKIPRRSREEEITAGGYNVIEEAKRLEQIYLDFKGQS